MRIKIIILKKKEKSCLVIVIEHRNCLSDYGGVQVSSRTSIYIVVLPGGVALASPSLQSRFNEHSNALFFVTDAGLIKYSGNNDDKMATSSSSGFFLGVLVFSVMLPNLLVITFTDMIALVLN